MPVNENDLPVEGGNLGVDVSGILARFPDTIEETNRIADEFKLAADVHLMEAETAEEHIAVVLSWSEAFREFVGVVKAGLPIIAGQLVESGVLSAANQQATQDCWLKNLLSGKPLFDGLPGDVTAAIQNLIGGAK